MTKRDLLQHELIGLMAEVVDSSNPNLVGKKGRIVDETRNTIAIEEASKIKKLQKSTVVLGVTLPSGERVKIDGKKLVARPEDRIKKYG